MLTKYESIDSDEEMADLSKKCCPFTTATNNSEHLIIDIPAYNPRPDIEKLLMNDSPAPITKPAETNFWDDENFLKEYDFCLAEENPTNQSKDDRA